MDLNPSTYHLQVPMNPAFGGANPSWDAEFLLGSPFCDINAGSGRPASSDSAISEPRSSLGSPSTYIPDNKSLKTEPDSTPERERVWEDPARPTKASAKRKRPNRYKNASPAILEKRRAQNRSSQRAYRERKEQLISDLENQLGEAKNRIKLLDHAYRELYGKYTTLQTFHMVDGGLN